MPMTPEAKRLLGTTIRELRGRLLADLHAATESMYLLGTRVQREDVRQGRLSEAAYEKRRRLEAWFAEQVRAQGPARRGQGARREADFRLEVEKQAAYTWLNRLVVLRLLEGHGLRSPKLVSGGWESPAYRDFRLLAPALLGDPSEGYAFLLQLAFEELATDLPGLFGPAGMAELVPVPAATLRRLVDDLDQPALASCWSDDMTLGWVYQYWNDPEREGLDTKLNQGGKIEPHEIASKTQMFTERYMVDWLLHNSLLPMWLATCKRNGWVAEVESDGTLARLEARRVAWRARREAGEVALTELMPLDGEREHHWAYYVPQELPLDAVGKAPETVRNLKILDPAVGSGHFLVVAFDLLVALYREEARHRGEAGQPQWQDAAVAERILGHNLHGIDLDPRAVQIAAAALWLKMRLVSATARPERLNLVAANLRLASLAEDDPALVELRAEVEKETGIPGVLTDAVVHALKGADHLGSLLKVDAAVDVALARHEAALGKVVPEQGDLFGGFSVAVKRTGISKEAAKAGVLGLLEGFLARHTGGDDLGLRLRGEQLAAGVRFVRLAKEGAYDLVVANPPYQGASKLSEKGYLEASYVKGKADLYAAFLERGLQLVRVGGVSAMLTMRGWMFIKQFSELRQWLLEGFRLRGLADLSSGAFREIAPAQVVVSVAMAVFEKGGSRASSSVAVRPFDDRTVLQVGETDRKEAALLAHVNRHDFDPLALKVVPEWPVVYWWDAEMLRVYGSAPLIGVVAPARATQGVYDNTRFIRQWFEVALFRFALRPQRVTSGPWVPFTNGAAGVAWIEPQRLAVRWGHFGLEPKCLMGHKTASMPASYANEASFFQIGIAFSMIGAGFTARLHRFPGPFGGKGRSVFPTDIANAVCAMNSSRARDILQSLNPGIGFEVGDVNRLPLFQIPNASDIFATLESAFTTHESHREPSVEFLSPGPSPWRHAQAWAQLAVDRPDSTPLPPYTAIHDPEPATDHLTYALGIALGRFSPHATGTLEPATADLSHALPAGILFLDGSLPPNDDRDSLGHPACAPLHTAWAAHRDALTPNRAALRDYLRLDVFAVHRSTYENRPIHWPLSSANKTFVAWVQIHRMTAQTLRILLADHLFPALARLDGELADLRQARDTPAQVAPDKRNARFAEQALATAQRHREELQDFINLVSQCADRGPPGTDHREPAREQDARYDPDLDDGVMINSAALWPLLLPHWRDPKKWWSELAQAANKKDYDWSHLAMRYWPSRVDHKCRLDPSLGVAHGCFWRYHPARAWAWELRLQQEIAGEFRICEVPYRPGGRDVGDPGDATHRDTWLRDHPQEALDAVEKEAVRRLGRGAKRQQVPEMRILEPGMWSALPEQAWALELRVARAQGAEFHLRAPDEPRARAALLAAKPQLAKERESIVAGLQPPQLLPQDGDDSGDDQDADGTDNDED